MKITIYTINDCKFSQAEKDYLKKNSIDFEEKNLESNRDFLTEMLAISNNFAGTPVTQIEKDNGEKIVLKGFTAEEFDKALGITSVAVAANDASPQPPAETAAPQPEVQAPVSPVAESPTEVAPAPEATQSSTTAQASEPVVIESLSEDTSQVTSTVNPEPTMPPISTEPVNEAMAQPSSPQAQEPPVTEPTPTAVPQDMGPITLEVTPPQEPLVSAEAAPTEVPPMQPPQIDAAPAAPAVEPTAQAPQQTPAQGNPLDSVLQNLQSQVSEAAPKKEDGQPPQQ